MHPSWDLRKEWFIFPLKVSLFFLSLSLTETWAYPLILPLCICHRKKEEIWFYRKWDQKWLAQLREHVIRWSGDDYAITRSCDHTWPRGQVVSVVRFSRCCRLNRLHLWTYLDRIPLRSHAQIPKLVTIRVSNEKWHREFRPGYL